MATTSGSGTPSSKKVNWGLIINCTLGATTLIALALAMRSCEAVNNFGDQQNDLTENVRDVRSDVDDLNDKVVDLTDVVDGKADKSAVDELDQKIDAKHAAAIAHADSVACKCEKQPQKPSRPAQPVQQQPVRPTQPIQQQPIQQQTVLPVGKADNTVVGDQNTVVNGNTGVVVGGHNEGAVVSGSNNTVVVNNGVIHVTAQQEVQDTVARCKVTVTARVVAQRRVYEKVY